MFSDSILRNAFFSGLHLSTIAFILKRSAIIHFQSGEFLYSAGQPADGSSPMFTPVYLVLEGRLSCFGLRSTCFKTYVKGSYVGDIETIQNCSRLFAVKTQQKTTALKLTTDLVKSLQSTYPEFYTQILQQSVKRLIKIRSSRKTVRKFELVARNDLFWNSGATNRILKISITNLLNKIGDSPNISVRSNSGAHLSPPARSQLYLGIAKKSFNLGSAFSQSFNRSFERMDEKTQVRFAEKERKDRGNESILLRVPELHHRRNLLRLRLTNEQVLDKEIQKTLSGVEQMAEQICSLESAVAGLSKQVGDLTQKKLKSERVASDIRTVLLGIIESARDYPTKNSVISELEVLVRACEEEHQGDLRDKIAQFKTSTGGNHFRICKIRREHSVGTMSNRQAEGEPQQHGSRGSFAGAGMKDSASRPELDRLETPLLPKKQRQSNVEYKLDLSQYYEIKSATKKTLRSSENKNSAHLKYRNSEHQVNTNTNSKISRFKPTDSHDQSPCSSKLHPKEFEQLQNSPQRKPGPRDQKELKFAGLTKTPNLIQEQSSAQKITIHTKSTVIQNNFYLKSSSQLEGASPQEKKEDSKPTPQPQVMKTTLRSPQEVVEKSPVGPEVDLKQQSNITSSSSSSDPQKSHGKLSNIPEDFLECDEQKTRLQKPERRQSSLKSDRSDKSSSSFRKLQAKRSGFIQVDRLGSFDNIRNSLVEESRMSEPPGPPGRENKGFLIEEKPQKKKRFKFFDVLKKPNQNFIEL